VSEVHESQKALGFPKKKFLNFNWALFLTFIKSKFVLFLASSLGINSGSHTPPPAGLSANGLGLLGVPRFSTAPGADRSVFGNTALVAAVAASSRAGLMGPGAINLFGGVVPTKVRHNSMDKGSANKSRLLDDFRYIRNKKNLSILFYLILCFIFFRNNRYPSLQLRDIATYVVEFSQDQHG